MTYQRIEIDVTPVDPALLQLAKTIRDCPTSTMQEKQLAIMFWSVAMTLNELLAKMEFGDLKISENISETPTTRFFPKP